MDKIERPSLQVGLASTAPLTSKGSPKIPLILVQFEDLKFTSANTNDSVNILFDKFCNGTNNGKNYRYHSHHIAYSRAVCSAYQIINKPERTA